MIFIKQPDGEVRLGDWLLANFLKDDPAWTRFKGVIAFVKASGVRHIVEALKAFIDRGGDVKFVVGVDLRGTSSEGLRMLLDCVGDHGEIWITHNINPSTFHPKIYLFEGQNRANVIIGSGNLTEGGLYTNYEGGIEFLLNLDDPQQRLFYNSMCQAITEWSDPNSGISKKLGEELLIRLIQLKIVPTEIATSETDETEPGRRGDGESRSEEGEPPIFRRISVRRPPQLPQQRGELLLRQEGGPIEVIPPLMNQNFVMTLQRTDAGTGQTSPGTSRRSPEIFIPLAARNANPAFWEWQNEFNEDQLRPGKFDRIGVRMRIGGQTITVNMMTWPVKHDFRLRSEALRSAGNIGDILRLEKVEEATGFSYYVEIIPIGTTQYEHYFALCANQTKDSLKRWGYF